MFVTLKSPRSLFSILVVLFASTAVADADVDIPTWEFNDRWTVTDTFTVAFEIETIRVEMDVQLDYSLIMIATGNRTPSGRPSERVYVRERFNGIVTGQGQATVDTISLPLALRPKAGGASLEGENWTRISDLALVRDAFEIEGSLFGTVPIFGEILIGDISLDLSVEFHPAAEFIDFPIGNSPEHWSLDQEVALIGSVDVVMNPNNGLGLDDVHESIDGVVSRQLNLGTAGTRVDSTLGVLNLITGGDLFSAAYSAEAKDLAEMDTDLFSAVQESGGLMDFRRRITGKTLRENAKIESVTIEPATVPQGGTFTVRGRTLGGLPVRARIDRTGATANTVSANNGAFSMELPAPPMDDDTPSDDDAGSYGVEVDAPQSQTPYRRVRTVRLQRVENSTSDRWTLY